MSANPSASERTRAVRAGLSAVGLWIVIEFGIRDVAWRAFVWAAERSGRRLGSGELMTLNAALLWPALVVLGLAFLWLKRREGLSWSALGYRPWRSAILTGIISLIVIWGLSLGASALTVHLLGTGKEQRFMDAMRAAGLPMMLVTMLPANGILGPMVEELAWRGYIQTHLIRGWGLRSGIVVTAVLFALKHVIVDFSFYRILILLAGGVALGITGYRWGTSASTIAHVLLNSLATVSAMLEIWHQ